MKELEQPGPVTTTKKKPTHTKKTPVNKSKSIVNPCSVSVTIYIYTLPPPFSTLTSFLSSVVFQLSSINSNGCLIRPLVRQLHLFFSLSAVSSSIGQIWRLPAFSSTGWGGRLIERRWWQRIVGRANNCTLNHGRVPTKGKQSGRVYELVSGSQTINQSAEFVC